MPEDFTAEDGRFHDASARSLGAASLRTRCRHHTGRPAALPRLDRSTRARHRGRGAAGGGPLAARRCRRLRRRRLVVPHHAGGRRRGAAALRRARYDRRGLPRRREGPRLGQHVPRPRGHARPLRPPRPRDRVPLARRLSRRQEGPCPLAPAAGAAAGAAPRAHPAARAHPRLGTTGARRRAVARRQRRGHRHAPRRRAQPRRTLRPRRRRPARRRRPPVVPGRGLGHGALRRHRLRAGRRGRWPPARARRDPRRAALVAAHPRRAGALPGRRHGGRPDLLAGRHRLPQRRRRPRCRRPGFRPRRQRRARVLPRRVLDLRRHRRPALLARGLRAAA